MVDFDGFQCVVSPFINKGEALESAFEVVVDRRHDRLPVQGHGDAGTRVTGQRDRVRQPVF